MGETHFARRNFFTHGKAIYLQLVEVGEEEAPSMLELLADGQWAIPGMIERIGEQIDFSPSDHLAERWFPPGYGRMIALDPKIAFGRPVLYQRGVPTAAIHDLYLGEGEVTGAVCEWMELKPREVEKAVAFERELAA